MTSIERRLALALPALALSLPANAQAPAILLFRVVSQRDEVIIGLTPTELATLGTGPEVERIGRKLAADGQVGAWRYVVGRAADGSTRYGATGRVSILRQDTYRIEPYTAAIPVAPPPG